MINFTKISAPDCFSCQFKSSCFCDKLEPAAQKAWNKIRLAAALPADHNIYSEYQKPEGVYIVCRGRVKVFSTDSKGSQMITWIRHPGEVFGHIALFSKHKYMCASRTMGSTTLSFITAKALNEFLTAHPGTYPLLLRKIANELGALQLRLKDTAYKPAKSKVALALINAISYKSKNTDMPAIHGLKRTEIAEITGLALETVVRALAELEKRKILKRETKAIKILNYSSLVKLSGTLA